MLELLGSNSVLDTTVVNLRLRLKKITSINSQTKLHKEKEMADFRKWLMAFAIVALMLGLQVSGNAQTLGSAFTCVANAGVPPIVRSEGVTELVGDLLLNCTGGTPTPATTTIAGVPVPVPIPLSNVQVFLNTNITSRLINASNYSEATLTIDEPFPGAQPPFPPGTTGVTGATQTQVACAAVNSTNCAIYGVATASGAGIDGVHAAVGTNGPYNGGTYTINDSDTTLYRYNVFQGLQNGANSVVWLGVPIDAPGTTGSRVIRITNIRANACQLGVSSTLIPTQIVAFISVNGSQQVTINNPQQTVAFIQPGLVISSGTATYPQCTTVNTTLISSSNSGGITEAAIDLTATEGFASSFKVRNYAQIENSSGASLATAGATDGTVNYQNVLGYPYNTESGFVANPTTPSGGGAVDFGLGTGAVGLADTGTEISFTINGIGAGVNLFVPTTVILQPSGGGTQTGTAILVSGASSAGAVTISGTTATIVYEVIYANPNVIEEILVPVQVAFISNTQQNLPGTGQATAAVNFYPLSTSATASTGPIPRFCQPHTAANFFLINSCTCDLLFPFITNQAGFDTGVAIANTSSDPFGTVPQSGTVKLWYYGGTTGGGAAPAAQTSQSVAAGAELVFTLSNGGNLGIAATPGFQGYMIAVAQFQYCHGFAFISDLGAQKLAEGYLAIQLDIPFWTNGIPGFAPTDPPNRTGQSGESQGQ